jgi:hypothetical protein
VTIAPSFEIAKPRRRENAMVMKRVDPIDRLRKELESDNDMLRSMVREFAEGLMSAEADAACGASGRLVRRRLLASHHHATELSSAPLGPSIGRKRSVIAPSECPDRGHKARYILRPW